MIAPQITNHVQAALDRLMQQYKGKPNLQAVLTAFIQQIQVFENAAYPVDAGRQLYNGTTYPAVGTQLDGIGELVGVKRNGLGDAEYLVFILGTIAENFSDDTMTTLVNIMVTFFQPTLALIFENYPAEVDLELSDSVLPVNLLPIVAGILQNSIGAGVNLGYIAMFSLTTSFRYADARTGTIPPPGTGLGYDDATAPGAGGHYGNIIFNKVA